jgi:sugar phosphate isomerase/epimerase
MIFKKSISVSPIKTGFGPVLFAGRLGKGISIIADLEFDAIELSIRDPEEKAVRDALKISSDYGLKISAIATGQSYYNDHISLSDLSEGRRKSCVRRMISHIDLASSLGSFVIIGGVRGAGKNSDKSDLPQYINNLKDSIIEMVSYAEKKKVVLLLEPINRYETILVNDAIQALNLLDEVRSENFKILLDTYHMNIEEKSIEESLKMTKDSIKYVHFADSNRLAPGWGYINFKSIVSTLNEIGYEGFIGFEILPKPGDHEAAVQTKDFFDSFLSEGEDRQ